MGEKEGTGARWAGRGGRATARVRTCPRSEVVRAGGGAALLNSRPW
jgi:hypothetical protein